jgi:hypothetical protein
MSRGQGGVFKDILVFRLWVEWWPKPLRDGRAICWWRFGARIHLHDGLEGWDFGKLMDEVGLGRLALAQPGGFVWLGLAMSVPVQAPSALVQVA